MATFKVVVSDPKTRKAYQKEVDQAASGLIGKKIGEKVAAAAVGLEGYTIEITGGSDGQGFPMRKDVIGSGRKRLLIAQPPGFHPKKQGQRKRKSICGNTVSQDIVQVNAAVVEYGKKGIEELLGKKDKKAEEKKEGKEEKKPETKEEPKKEAAPKEKKVEPKKEEPKPEQKKPEKKEEPKKEAKEEKKEEKPAEEKMGVKELKD